MSPPRDLSRLADVFAEAFTRAKATEPGWALERALEIVFALDAEHHRLAAGEVLPKVVVARAKKSKWGTSIRSSAQLWLPLIERVAHEHGLKLKDLTGPSTVRAISAVRQEAMWRLTHQEHVSQEVTAAALNRRDHTSVIYGARKFEARMVADPELRARMSAAREAA